MTKEGTSDETRSITSDSGKRWGDSLKRRSYARVTREKSTEILRLGDRRILLEHTEDELSKMPAAKLPDERQNAEKDTRVEAAVVRDGRLEMLAAKLLLMSAGRLKESLASKHRQSLLRGPANRAAADESQPMDSANEDALCKAAAKMLEAKLPQGCSKRSCRKDARSEAAAKVLELELPQRMLEAKLPQGCSKQSCRKMLEAKLP